MIRLFIISVITLLGSLALAQDANLTWKGNKAYRNMDYSGAQANYENSLSISPSSATEYNLANALYKQQKYEDAAKIYSSIASKSTDKNEKAQAFHNLGNSMLKSKQIDKGIEAYKQALRNNPTDEDTRYNLSYAMKLKKQQEEQEKQDQDQNEDQDKQDQDKEDKQDQQNQDNQDKKDEEQKDDQQKQDQQDQQNQDKQDQQEQQQQQKPDEISKEDAQRLLDNMENEEEKTREKVQLQKRKIDAVKIENDW